MREEQPVERHPWIIAWTIVILLEISTCQMPVYNPKRIPHYSLICANCQFVETSIWQNFIWAAWAIGNCVFSAKQCIYTCLWQLANHWVNMEDFGRVFNKMPSVTWSLGMPFYWDMGNVAEGRRHWNYFNKCNRKVHATKLCYFCAPWLMHALAHSLRLKRGQVCLWADHWKWLAFICPYGG